MRRYICGECHRQWWYHPSRKEAVETHERQYGHHVFILDDGQPPHERFDEE